MATTLSSELGILVVVAVGVALLFHRLRLPAMLGYVLTGLLLGPEVLGERSPVEDLGVVRELAELGVLFLMFSLGMEFDLGRLRRVLLPAGLALALQTIVMMEVGLQSAALLGLEGVEGLFLGSILAISSSMVSVAVLQGRGEMKQAHGQLAVGILILEDILAILLLVILTGVGVQKELPVGMVGVTTAGVAIFTVSLFFVGKLFAPRLIEALRGAGNEELVTLSAVGLALGVGALAGQFSFSVALGSFLAGSILAQTSLVEPMERAIEPLRRVFGAIFFISVGMEINPQEIAHVIPGVLVVAVLTVVGKVATCWLGAYLAGQQGRTGFRAAAMKAQIGEFSFVIASLGLSLGVAGPELLAVAVGVALVTIVVSGPLAGGADGLYGWLEARMPKGLALAGGFYQKMLQKVREQLDRSLLWRLVQRPILQILLTVLLLSGILLGASWGAGWLEHRELLPGLGGWGAVAVWLGAAAVSLPFGISIVRNLNAVVMLLVEALLSGASSQQFLRGNLRNLINSLLLALVLVVAGGGYFAAAAPYLPRGVALLAFLGTLGVAGLLLWKQMIRVNSRLEFLFMESLKSESQQAEAQRRDRALQEISAKYPWPVSVRALTVPEACAGRRLQDLRLREEAGVTVVGIGRGTHVAYDPSPKAPVFPGDRLLVFGQEGQIRKAGEALAKPSAPCGEGARAESFQVEKVLLGASSPLVGNTLAGADLRRSHGLNVLGIQRGEERITAPRAETLLQAGDLLLVMGSKEALERWREA